MFLIILGLVAFGIGLYKNAINMQKQEQPQHTETGEIKNVQTQFLNEIDWQTIILSNQMPAFTFKVSQAPQEIIKESEKAKEVASVNQSIITENEHTDDVSEVTDTIDIHLTKRDIETPVGVEINGDEQVLIYHTHTREAYMQSPGYEYKEPKAEPYRCDNFDYTVVHVGDVLAESLKAKGVGVVHNITEHEQQELGTAYVRSLDTIQKLVEESNDQFNLLIDIHRDGYTEGTEDPDDHVVVIDGKRYAKFFVLIGTGEGQAGGFSIKPDWETNYQVAQALTTIANQEYPGLAEDVLIKKGRYNQHVTDNMILIEIGSNVTTMDEAERTAELLGEIIYKWLAINNE